MTVPPACYRSLTRIPWLNPTASEFSHDGSPGLLQVANGNPVVKIPQRVSSSITVPPACYRSLTRIPWLNPTASEFSHDGFPGLLQIANGNPVVESRSE